jgi:hypothetical protein
VVEGLGRVLLAIDWGETAALWSCIHDTPPDAGECDDLCEDWDMEWSGEVVTTNVVVGFPHSPWQETSSVYVTNPLGFGSILLDDCTWYSPCLYGPIAVKDTLDPTCDCLCIP